MNLCARVDEYTDTIFIFTLFKSIDIDCALAQHYLTFVISCVRVSGLFVLWLIFFYKSHKSQLTEKLSRCQKKWINILETRVRPICLKVPFYRNSNRRFKNSEGNRKLLKKKPWIWESTFREFLEFFFVIRLWRHMNKTLINEFKKTSTYGT